MSGGKARTTVRRPERSRKGRYVIVDPYLRFYFRFLAPNLGFIERGMVEQAVNLMRDHLVDSIGTHAFEELCRDWVAAQADTGALPFLPERIGSFWSQEAQVDVVAVNWRTKDILLGECKWGTDAVGRMDLPTCSLGVRYTRGRQDSVESCVPSLGRGCWRKLNVWRTTVSIRAEGGVNEIA